VHELAAKKKRKPARKKPTRRKTLKRKTVRRRTTKRKTVRTPLASVHDVTIYWKGLMPTPVLDVWRGCPKPTDVRGVVTAKQVRRIWK